MTLDELTLIRNYLRWTWAGTLLVDGDHDMAKLGEKVITLIDREIKLKTMDPRQSKESKGRFNPHHGFCSIFENGVCDCYRKDEK